MRPGTCGLYRTCWPTSAHVARARGGAELSTRRLLTMTWLDGEPLLSFEAATRRSATGSRLHMFRAWYVPFYGYGVIHGDPHLGNYTVRAGSRLNLLDFGCIRVFPPASSRASSTSTGRWQRGDRDLAVHAYETWGFQARARGDRHPQPVGGFLYGPLMEDRPRLIEENQHRTAARWRAGPPAAARVGGVTPPREFVFMDRAAVGLGCGVPAPLGRDQLAPALHGADRGLRRRRADGTADRGAAAQGLSPPT